MTSPDNSELWEDFSPTRYLIPFHAKRQPHFFTDVLIIGGGLAGIRAALAVDPSLRVLVVCKDGLTNSNSGKAQGGIATVWNLDDDNYTDFLLVSQADTSTVTASQIEQFLQEEIVKLRKTQAETRRKLKNVRKELTADIDRLGLTLKVINICLVPALVILLGLLRGFMRRRH